jgi:hypothetical protein
MEDVFIDGKMLFKENVIREIFAENLCDIVA